MSLFSQPNRNIESVHSAFPKFLSLGNLLILRYLLFFYFPLIRFLNCIFRRIFQLVKCCHVLTLFQGRVSYIQFRLKIIFSGIG